MEVKVCGMREEKNIKGIAALMPDYMGFIFYKPSPRYAGDMLNRDVLDSIDSNIIKVGVFVNEERASLLETVRRYGLDMVQLHGDESPEYCRSLKEEGLGVIKAFFPGGDKDPAITGSYNDCDYHLFDNRGSGWGGSGKSFDWELLKGYRLDKPFFLGGGIGPGDISLITGLQGTLPRVIDINSGFETAPGLKDEALTEDFISKIRHNIW